MAPKQYSYSDYARTWTVTKMVGDQYELVVLIQETNDELRESRKQNVELILRMAEHA